MFDNNLRVKKLSKKAAKKARRLARAKELIDSYLFYCGMAINIQGAASLTVTAKSS